MERLKGIPFTSPQIRPDPLARREERLPHGSIGRPPTEHRSEAREICGAWIQTRALGCVSGNLTQSYKLIQIIRTLKHV